MVRLISLWIEAITPKHLTKHLHQFLLGMLVVGIILYMVQYGIFRFQLHIIKGGWLFSLPRHISPVCREPGANNASSLKPQEIAGKRFKFPFTLLGNSSPAFILVMLVALSRLSQKCFDTFFLLQRLQVMNPVNVKINLVGMLKINKLYVMC